MVPIGQFAILGTRHSNPTLYPNAAAIRTDYWMEGDEEHMDVAVADVLPEGVSVSYEYDYGSPTDVPPNWEGNPESVSAGGVLAMTTRRVGNVRRNYRCAHRAMALPGAVISSTEV